MSTPNSTVGVNRCGKRLTNTAQHLLKVRKVQIVGAGTGVNIVGGNANVFLRKISISNATIAILSTKSKVSLEQSDLIDDTVALSRFFSNTFNDNYIRQRH